MKLNYLLPHRFKVLGLILLIPGLTLSFLYLLGLTELEIFDFTVFSIAMESWNNDSQFFTFIENNILDELAGTLVLVALILLAFSKEKYEDEFIGQLRLQSLVWATYTNYIILFIAILFIYDILFYWVLVFNMFTLLIFFVIHFNITMAKTKNQISDEE